MIRKYEFIGEYLGIASVYTEDDKSDYLVSLGVKSSFGLMYGVDATKFGNLTRYVSDRESDMQKKRVKVTLSNAVPCVEMHAGLSILSSKAMARRRTASCCLAARATRSVSTSRLSATSRKVKSFCWIMAHRIGHRVCICSSWVALLLSIYRS